MAPPGCTHLVTEHFCFRGDATWSASDAELIETTAGHGTLDPSQLAGLRVEQRGAVVAAFRESWMNGFRLSLLVAGLVLLIAAVVANRFIPGRAHAREVTAAARVGDASALEVS